MRAAGFGPGFGNDPKDFAIVWSSILRPLPGHQQVPKKQAGIRKTRIGAQRRLQFALRLVEMTRPSEHHRVVVPGCGISRPETQGDLKLIPSLSEPACSRKKTR